MGSANACAVNGNWSSVRMGVRAKPQGPLASAGILIMSCLGLGGQGGAREIAVGSRREKLATLAQEGVVSRQGSPLQQRKQNPEKDLTWIF